MENGVAYGILNSGLTILVTMHALEYYENKANFGRHETLITPRIIIGSEWGGEKGRPAPLNVPDTGLIPILVLPCGHEARG